MRNNGRCDRHGVFVFDVNDNGCTTMLTLYCTVECTCILYLCIFSLVTSTDLKLRSVYYNDYFYAAAHTCNWLVPGTWGLVPEHLFSHRHGVILAILVVVPRCSIR